MKFAVSTNGDNILKIWSLTREDEKCGKLAQVLVGHSDAVTCAAVSVTNRTQVTSGSKDTNLIIWDLHAGEEIHTLAGHLAPVIGVKVSADGSTAVTGSDDKTLIVWETKRGLALTSLQLRVPFPRFDISMDCSRILVQLVDSFNLPVICLHNTPAQYIKLPTYSAPVRDVEDDGFCTCTYYCRDKERNPVTDIDFVLWIWKESFSQLLVSDNGGHEYTTEPISDDGTECVPPTQNEVDASVTLWGISLQ
ncbi:protein qui-1-like [Stomoxys calcitrans]|uniref:protein qui-1-like n=1 Tax=Stomoxys calcitrans TaxID=35570 RepID=UPI0027E25BF1|nr:protein qui-1-like [Stomoxys calcitrans]